MIFANLKAEIIVSGQSIQSIAKHIGITEKELDDKIHGYKTFNVDDISKILSIFNQYTFEYLFKPENIETK